MSLLHFTICATNKKASRKDQFCRTKSARQKLRRAQSVARRSWRKPLRDEDKPFVAQFCATGKPSLHQRYGDEKHVGRVNFARRIQFGTHTFARRKQLRDDKYIVAHNGFGRRRCPPQNHSRDEKAFVAHIFARRNYSSRKTCLRDVCFRRARITKNKKNYFLICLLHAGLRDEMLPSRKPNCTIFYFLFFCILYFK